MGELVRVRGAGQPALEMTEIQTRLIAEGGPAVLFENVVGPDGKRSTCRCWSICSARSSAWPCGMERRPDQLREVGETLAFLKQPEPPGGWREALDMLPLVKTRHDHAAQDVSGPRPARRSSGPARTSIWPSLPIQTCWPGEPAPLITWPLVVTQGPKPGADKADNFNLGIYRMQVTGRNTTLMRWLKHRGGAQHHARWKEAKAASPCPRRPSSAPIPARSWPR